MSAPRTPTGVLREEHRRILQLADVLERVVGVASSRGAVDFGAAEECVTLVRLYADALHHGKEEDLLFPELEESGMPADAGPIAVMLEEHREGRVYAKAMADALPLAREGDGAALRRLVNAARGWVSLIRGHILKEDHVLFEAADDMLAAPRCAALCDAYEEVCARRFDGCTVADMESKIERLLAEVPPG